MLTNEQLSSLVAERLVTNKLSAFPYSKTGAYLTELLQAPFIGYGRFSQAEERRIKKAMMALIKKMEGEGKIVSRPYDATRDRQIGWGKDSPTHWVVYSLAR